MTVEENLAGLSEILNDVPNHSAPSVKKYRALEHFLAPLLNLEPAATYAAHANKDGNLYTRVTQSARAIAAKFAIPVILRTDQDPSMMHACKRATWNMKRPTLLIQQGADGTTWGLRYGCTRLDDSFGLALLDLVEEQFGSFERDTLTTDPQSIPGTSREDALPGALQPQSGLLLLRLDGSTIDLSAVDPTVISQAVAPIIADPEILEALAGGLNGAEILRGIQTSLRLADLERATDELRTMLSDPSLREQRYQEWCQRYGWAFGNIYVIQDSVRNITRGDSVDGLLSQTANGLRDIYELKRPDMDAIKYDETHKSYYWSADTSKAIGQCHRYLDRLHEAAATGLLDHPEIIAYHPRAVIVIGRSTEWSIAQLRALHGLNARLHSITVITYDQLLAQADQLVRTLRG
ncbi:Shedu anti-phage system protein SduA domain-containing protein [Kitasatospora sp. SUK 42]|uniref:Shedu anti-phage system protein SduA domain-containing protein n=1 Tax=Kitasatospora sp. SUK 42 TaxID=1588882 RepID=UPI0018CAC61B|nr:Shedu anti-phage system protein SduA domain-containing protein [Kitasatospora sp. SUK 42]MBV2152959.1 DUF4263 domain-containing protein [Kitasatospora sp. SUK 42]